jgi:hypothetical protein
MGIGELHSLGIRYGTDKATYHDYLNFYENNIGHLKNERINIMEIGFLHGNSIKMWLDYFTNARIYCLDIIDCSFTHERFHYIKISQDNPILDNIFPDSFFDLIIDDGSHMTSHQIKSLEILWKKVKSPGFYILEDLHTSFSKEYADTEITAYEIINGEKSIQSISPIMEETSSIEIFRKNHGVGSNSLTSILKK